MRCAPEDRDRGQSVLLIPAGFLILLVLGSLVLEAAALHLHQRQLNDLAASAASDASAFGFDIEAFRETGEVSIDPALAASVLDPAIAISLLDDATGVVRVIPGDPPAVEVELSVEHEYIIGRSLLGGVNKTLTAVGTAELVLSGP
jgi:hypothetical protein